MAGTLAAATVPAGLLQPKQTSARGAAAQTGVERQVAEIRISGTRTRKTGREGPIQPSFHFLFGRRLRCSRWSFGSGKVERRRCSFGSGSNRQSWNVEQEQVLDALGGPSSVKSNNPDGPGWEHPPLPAFKHSCGAALVKFQAVSLTCPSGIVRSPVKSVNLFIGTSPRIIKLHQTQHGCH